MRFCFALLAALLLPLGSLPARAQGSEAAVKAAFVYNFAKFVEWPPEVLYASGQTLNLCLVGPRDGFLNALTTLDGKVAQGKEIRVRAATLRADTLRGCQMLALAEGELRQLEDILRLAGNTPLLTISENERFAELGGIIALVVSDNRVQFEINVDAAQRVNLRLSSQLLKLARNTRKP
ncbi:MAG: hypothetical protein RIR00_1510 [Pseudomonadota bacterium]|jgi:hypothetical protein